MKHIEPRRLVEICSQSRLYELHAGWPFGVQAGNIGFILMPVSKLVWTPNSPKRLDHGSQAVMTRLWSWVRLVTGEPFHLSTFPQNSHNHPHNPPYRHHSLPQEVTPSSLGHPYKL